MGDPMARRVIILGAAGRDFHNFNVYFREATDFEVVGFTAAQIPNIEGRRYPADLSGSMYPEGIPIWPESDLESLIRKFHIDAAVFAYSDVSYEHVMTIGSRAMAAGADLMVLGPQHTQIPSRAPVIAVCAARTGSGKSQTTRRVAAILKRLGKRTVTVRHPMPYGDLTKQAVQRFATYDDFAAHDVTIEEREEYEPIIEAGGIVYAGIDYGRILAQAEEEADIILWDGGNNDFAFYRPDLLITVVDAHRPDHALRYFPGGVNVRRADIVVINKVDTADTESIERAMSVTRDLNPTATLVRAASPISVDQPELIEGKRVLVVEDGPYAHAWGNGIRSWLGGRTRLRSQRDCRPTTVGCWVYRRDVRQMAEHRNGASRYGIR